MISRCAKRLKLSAKLAAGVVAITPAMLFAAQVPDTAAHNNARKALAAQDYKGVITAYSGYSELTPIANYRLAIAMSKTGDSVKAYELYLAAINADPKGTFASSPQRLQSFKEGLLAACEEDGAPACKRPEKPVQALAEVAAPIAVVKPQPIQEQAEPKANIPLPLANATATTTPSVVVPAMVVAQPPPSTPVDVAPGVATGTPSAVYEVETAYFLLGAALLLTVLTILAFKLKRKPAPDAVTNLLEATQNLHQVVKSHLAMLPENALLHQKLKALEPLLEQEVGRAYLAKFNDPSKLVAKDAIAHEMQERYKGKPILISQASPDEVTALFQRSRWN